MKRKILKNIEWSILISTIILVIIGLVALTSATKNSNYEELKKQILWLTISIPILIVVIFVDYDIFAKISPITIWNNIDFTCSCTIYKCNKWSDKLV